MFFGAIDRLTYSNLKCELEDLRNEKDRLRRANDEYKKRIDSEFSSASFAIDWDTMNVFSVERNWSHGFPTTILGYMLSEPVTHTEEQVTYKDVVREWTLHCSAETHEKLVEEFNAWKSNK